VKKRVLAIDGHPDPTGAHLGNALAAAYASAAQSAGHEVRRVAIAMLDFPLLRTLEHAQAPPASIAAVQADIAWANHLAIFYPMWNADMPALLRGFLEQTFREGFSVATTPPSGVARTFDWDFPGVTKLLAGRSARVVVTMRMPSFLYRIASQKGLERFLWVAGISPVRVTPLGGVALSSEARRARWLATMRELGSAAM
jgi:putative NADPH-quinone reductase